MKRQNKLTILGITLFSAIILSGINSSQSVKADISNEDNSQTNVKESGSNTQAITEGQSSGTTETPTNNQQNNQNDLQPATKPVNQLTPKTDLVKTSGSTVDTGLSQDMEKQTVPVKRSVTNTDDISGNSSNSKTNADSYPMTGTNGTSTWSLDDDGTMHIGTGTLSDTVQTLNPGYNNGLLNIQRSPILKQIKQITLDGPVVAASDSSYLFANLPNLTQINNLTALNTSNVKNMDSIFLEDPSLTSVNVSGFNTSNVTNMDYLFLDDSSLTNLDVSNFVTKNVINMFGTFAGDYNITNITGLNNWDVSNVQQSAGMFSNTNDHPGQLDDATIATMTGWKTSKDMDMTAMFQNQNNIKTVDFSGWIFNNSAKMNNVFYNDKSLSTLKLDNLVFDSTNPQTKSNIFFNDYGLSYLKAQYMVDGKPLKVEITGPSILYSSDTKVTVVDDPTLSLETSNSGIFPILKNEVDFETEELKQVGSYTAQGLYGDEINPYKNVPKGYMLTPESQESDYLINGVSPIIIIVETDPNYKPTNNNNTSSSTKHPSHSQNDAIYENQKQNVTTFSDKVIPVYDDNGHATNKNISNNDWTSDEVMTINGNKYYHLNDNQWIKYSDAYAYYENKSYILTFVGDNKQLVHVDGTPVSRELRPSTDWVTDRYTDIDGTKYFRVATNEWVSGNEVIEYVPNKTIVSTSNTAQLYDETGKLVNDRELGSNTSWQSDRYATINGVKMYRVATNEWVPASVVSVE